MKKIFNLSFAAIAGILAFAACSKEEEKVEIPAVITASFDNLAKTGIVEGTPNQINLTANSADATVTLTVYSEQKFLEDASFSVGTAAGNVAIHYKDKYVDNDAVSGSLAISSDEDFNYTVTGTVMLDNAEGTAVKLTATGRIEFELTPLYYYVKGSKDGATVYDIYTLGDTNELLAKATVFGETGKFEIAGTKAEGTALYGNAALEGCFAKSGATTADGFFMQLSGDVTISKKAGQLSFAFKGAREATYNNCKEVSKVNVPAVVVPALDGSEGVILPTIKVYSVPSQIVDGAYEITAKFFFNEYEVHCATILAGFSALALNENYHPAIKGYDEYLAAVAPEATVASLGIGPACYYTLDGEPLAVPQDGTRYAQIWYLSDDEEGNHTGFTSMIDANMTLMDEVFQWLSAKKQAYAAYGASYAPYAFMGYMFF